jgi:hypothetical protein
MTPPMGLLVFELATSLATLWFYYLTKDIRIYAIWFALIIFYICVNVQYYDVKIKKKEVAIC